MNLAEALERRSDRGSHRDPDTIITAARSVEYHGLPRLELETDVPTVGRRTATLAAAAVVTAALIAGGALAIVRSRTPADEQSVDAPAVPGVCGSPIENSVTPSTIAPSEFTPPKTALLPVAVPAGYCPTSVATPAPYEGQRYTVWSSCTDCQNPTASVSMARIGQSPDQTETREREHDDFTIKGRQIRFYPATGDQLLVEMVSRDGLEPGFDLSGWGVTKNELAGLATSLIDGNDIPVSAGLQLVFDGLLDPMWPGLHPADTTVQINYAPPDNSGQALLYSYQHSTDTAPNLMAFASGTPNATFTTLNGQPALVSTYQRATTILLQPDDHTLIGIESVRTGQRPPLTIDQLSTIALTPATTSDQRWTQLNLANSDKPGSP